ncbi:MAG: preprotein translocase subunit SecG [Muribaculaceae bacterium]|nr:preprotein translocase subunit SecG [Muribaculaceae bacterium]
MYIFLSILIVIAALLLIGAVLIQKSKGGGLASDYSQGNQYMGYRKTTDFIEKATWSLAIFICLISICASFAIKTPVTRSGMAPAPAATTAPAPAPTTAAPAPAAAPAAETPAAAPAAETPAAAPAAEAPAK